MSRSFKITALGQVGYIFEIEGSKIVIDPYLSDYVSDLYGNAFRRAIPIPMRGSEIKDLDLLLITHEHEDHCDPNTIQDICKANKEVSIICSLNCNEIISKIEGVNILNPTVGYVHNLKNISIRITPASHTNLEIQNGHSRYMGFILEFNGYKIYHPGDTIPFDTKEYFEGGFDLAFFPINERNYFREREGIVGNMTCREAIEWSKELDVKNWIPTHWDLFPGNSTNKEELDLIAHKLNVSNYRWINSGESIEIEY
ncbi:MAG: MBL fold metallo-hydrolase [bacterium]|nr:MBL fold metallo-hydrolase [bacterium]